MSWRETIARRRRWIAALVCLGWLAGFEVLPWLHVALHDDIAPHVHAADGTIIRVSFAESEQTHRHADGTIHKGHARPRRGVAHPGYSPDHGANSLAHHGVAVAPVAPPLHHPLPVDRRPQVRATIAVATPGLPSPPIASARGPPLLASC